MGIFGVTSTYDADVERATGEGNTSDDWVAVMHVCDRLTADTNKDAPRECMKAILKRMKNMAPHVALQALTLLDACEKNCGRAFRLEIASRMFEDEVRNLLSNSRVHVAVREKLKGIIKQWAHEPDILADAELKLIPDMYKSLAAQGYEFPKVTTSTGMPGAGGFPSLTTRTAAPSSVPSASGNSTAEAATLRIREEEELARAIALSIREAEQSGIPVDTNITSVKGFPHDSSSLKAKSPSGMTSSSLYGNLLRDTVAASSSKSQQAKTSNQVKFDGIPFDSAESKNSSSRNSRQNTEYNKKELPEIITDYSQVVEPKRCRVLYDFEAVEGDELTLKAGEIVLVSDDSDPSWWKGSNPRGEGLFPANFVTDQLDIDVNARDFDKKLSLNANDDDLGSDEEGVAGGKRTPTGQNKNANIFTEPLKIDETVVDRALELIHNADLTGERPDDASLGAYESRTYDMTPLIDAELEQVDRQHLKLTQLGQRLFEAIKLYHETMAAQAAAPPLHPAATGFMQSHQVLPYQHSVSTPSLPAQYQHQSSYQPSTMGGGGMPSSYWHQSIAAPQQQQQHQEYSQMPPTNNNAPQIHGADAANNGHQSQPWANTPLHGQPISYGNAQWPQQGMPGTNAYSGGGFNGYPSQ